MIESTAQMTNRDWIQEPDGGDAPNFCFPSLVWPHLRVATSLVRHQSNPPWILDCLVFISRNGQELILYQRPVEGESDGIDHPEAIAYLAANFRAEADWAYGLSRSS